jgi:nitrogen regulatory protein P-II 1
LTKIEAIIRPSQLDAVKEALQHVWIAGLTVSELEGWGGPDRHSEVHRGTQLVLDVVTMLKVEVVVPDPLAPRLLFDLERAARGGPSDGRIVVTPVDEAVRVRTGERGEGAL